MMEETICMAMKVAKECETINLIYSCASCWEQKFAKPVQGIMKTIAKIIYFIVALAGLIVALSVYVTVAGTNSPPAWTPPTDYLPRDLRDFLESADEFTLYSLNSGLDFEHKEKNKFRGHAILGQIKIEAGADRTNLVTALGNGIAEGGPMADCFNPRHGIRAIKNGETVDFLICFQCGAIYAYSSDGTKWVFPVSRTPAALFNQTLHAAGIPLLTN